MKNCNSKFKIINLIQKERGVSLIEILVSSVVLVLTTVSIIGIFTSGFIVLKRAEASNRAVGFAKEKIEEFQNIAIEDIYPADCNPPGYPCALPSEEFDKDGVIDGILTEQMFATPPVIGSDAKIVCSVCGSAHKSTDAYCSDDGKYHCLNDDFNNDGVGGDYCGGSSYNCVASGKTMAVSELPGPGKFGWFTRIVRVRAYSIDENTNTFTNYDFAGNYDYKGNNAPVKQITVEIRWRGLGEQEQSYKMQTLFSRIIPKYVAQELGR